MANYDYKKEYKDLYLPKQKPTLIDVTEMTFIMVGGKGEPRGEEYQKAMQALYSLSYTIKMSKMSGSQPEGYFDYVVPPLEGLWWSEGGALDWTAPKSSWLWTSMIRQPEFVTDEIFGWAVEECHRKKPEVDVSRARLERFTEGLCIQTMHIGSYDDERPTVDGMLRYLDENDYIDESGNIRKHHEIYLSDPRKTAVEKLKTVLRLPIKKK